MYMRQSTRAAIALLALVTLLLAMTLAAAGCRNDS